jgi:hypothetical protein
VHHDNGVLGAATHADAERRRVRILKENGFNAVRSAHNPISRAFMEACDEYGLYVMDELTDVWFDHKTRHDSADRFEDVWRDDVAAMVAKDRNHASVIMYSIGNEIGETSTRRGVEVSAQVSAHVRELDPTRPTVNSINLMLNYLAAKGHSPFKGAQAGAGQLEPGKKVDSTAANMVADKIGSLMQLIARLPGADKASRDAFATVDISGYNYAYLRYRRDRERYPDRVIVGSESMPGDLPRIWRRVESLPGVIGDFMWTGWDYLGESGVGTWTYGAEPRGINKPYPALLAGTGAIDITGVPGAPALLARAVWGQADAPGLAVRPLDTFGKSINKTPWRSSDAIQSWAWAGYEGKAAEVEVYSDADAVELLLNGRSLGRKRAGRKAGFVARFRVAYELGELVAIGYRKGRETGRSALRSAGTPRLKLRAEETETRPRDQLAFVWMELADDAGTVESTAVDTVEVTVTGPAYLVGLGSAASGTEETYTDTSASTFRGQALGVVRRTGEPGTVNVTAASRDHGSADIELEHSSSAWGRDAMTSW